MEEQYNQPQKQDFGVRTEQKGRKLWQPFPPLVFFFISIVHLVRIDSLVSGSNVFVLIFFLVSSRSYSTYLKYQHNVRLFPESRSSSSSLHRRFSAPAARGPRTARTRPWKSLRTPVEPSSGRWCLFKRLSAETIAVQPPNKSLELSIIRSAPFDVGTPRLVFDSNELFAVVGKH